MHGSLSKCPWGPGSGRTKLRTWEFSLSPPGGWQEPRDLGHRHRLPASTLAGGCDQEQDWKSLGAWRYAKVSVNPQSLGRGIKHECITSIINCSCRSWLINLYLRVKVWALTHFAYCLILPKAMLPGISPVCPRASDIISHPTPLSPQTFTTSVCCIKFILLQNKSLLRIYK